MENYTAEQVQRFLNCQRAYDGVRGQFSYDSLTDSQVRAVLDYLQNVPEELRPREDALDATIERYVDVQLDILRLPFSYQLKLLSGRTSKFLDKSPITKFPINYIPLIRKFL